jgi:signal transduction histidine kinase
MTTLMNCDRNAGGRVSQFPLAGGDEPWLDEDLDLGPRVCQALFAAVVHDLKNSLTGVILWCDALGLLRPRLATSNDDQASALLSTVLEQINVLVSRSLHVIDDLLDITRVGAGHTLPIAAGEVDLVALVHEILESGPDAANTGRVRLESLEPELWGWWDADRLGRVLENLLTNAIKYSPADAPIVIRLAEYDVDGRAFALLEVEDQGIGIPEGELPRVFELFHRGQNVAPEIPGNGLGLWVSRAIVARHGGTLTLASREGQGTTVMLRLPLCPAPDEASAALLETRPKSP